MRRRLLAAALAVVPCASLLSGCGGVLEPPVSQAVEDLEPVVCSIARAAEEQANYEAAAALRTAGRRFRGDARDDLSDRMNRTRIFVSRVADLGRSERILRGLSTEIESEQALLDAAMTDLAAAKALMTYAREHAPGDPGAPPPPAEPPAALQAAIDASSDEAKEILGSCPTVIDLRNRSRAYRG